jgi:hypothetical protein
MEPVSAALLFPLQLFARRPGGGIDLDQIPARLRIGASPRMQN